MSPRSHAHATAVSVREFADTHPSLRKMALPLLRISLFCGLLVASALIGKIPLPGNPVGITLQTFVLMLTALSLKRSEAVASVAAYLSLGALGAPVFSGGLSFLAFFGPSAGYLVAFVPAVFVTASLKKKGSLLATVLGCVLLPLLIGIPVQALVTGLSLPATLAISQPFILNDLIKAAVASGIYAIAQRAAQHKTTLPRTL